MEVCNLSILVRVTPKLFMPNETYTPAFHITDLTIVCARMHSHLCVSRCTGLCLQVWKLEVDFKYLPLSPPYAFRRRSFCLD